MKAPRRISGSAALALLLLPVSAALLGSCAKEFSSQPDLRPSVSVAASPTSAYPPFSVGFFASGSDPDDTALEYTWDFGDGSPGATGSSAFHTYLVPGTFVATVRCSDPDGVYGTATVNIRSLSGSPPYTYTSHVATIFANNCTSCHSGASPSGNVDLTTHENAIAVLSNIRAAISPGGLMSAYLTDPDRAIVLQWINDGAP